MAPDVKLEWDGIGRVDETGVYWTPIPSDVMRLASVLREKYRVKLGIDFAYRQKYGKTWVYCDGMFRQAIQEAAAEVGINIEFQT